METQGQTDSYDVFAYGELCERCFGNIALVQRVLSSFMSSFAGDIEQLNVEIAAGNTSAVRKLAHRMKGGSGNAAALQLHHLSREVEQAAVRDDVDRLRQSMSELRTAWERFTEIAQAPPREQSHSNVNGRQTGDIECE